MIYVFKVDRTDFDILSKNNFDLFKKVIDQFDGITFTINSDVSSSSAAYLDKQEIFVKVTSNSPEELLKQISSKDIFPFKLYNNTLTNATYSANIHEDHVLDVKEIPAQSPFTNQHVGGNQHRHVNINQGSDDTSNRPELYNFDSDIVTGRDLQQPRAPFYREARSKSAANIKNIQSTDTVAGNFENNYQVINTTGRATNNLYFIQVGGNLLDDISQSPYISEIYDYQLPDRSTNKTVFVNLFSAPGGPETNARGSKDRSSEEYSVYNGMNNRNLVVRKQLNRWLSETSSIDANNNSYHQVNKNPSYVSGRTIYDNWFVNRQIPTNEAGYSWVSASLSGTVSGAYGYISKDQPNIDSSWNFIFLTSSNSGSGVIDFVGTNLLVQKNINTSSLTISPVDELKLNSYLLNLNGPYGFPTWKQIRGSENLINNSLKDNSIITVQNTESMNSNKYVDSVTQFYEPSFQVNKPLIMVISSSTEGVQELYSEYNNEKNYFSNPDLITRTTASFNSAKQTSYDHIKDLTNIIGSDGKPIYAIKSIDFQDVIFPRKQNIGLTKVKDKPNYAEEPGTGSNGYDKNIANIRTFWKSDNRSRSSDLNSTGTGSIHIFNYAHLSTSLENDIKYDTKALILADDGVNNFSSKIHTRIKVSNFTDSFNVLDNIINLTNSSDAYPAIQSTSGSTNTFLTYSSGIVGQLNTTEFLQRQYILLPSGTYIPSNITNSNTDGDDYFEYSSSYYRPLPQPQFLFLNHIPNFTEHATSIRYTGSSFYDVTLNNIFINGGIKYKTDILSNNAPWYDNYGQFSQDFKGFSAKYTILPEFSIKNQIEFYVKENNGNFNSLYTSSYLNLDGTDARYENVNLESVSSDILNNDLYKNEVNNPENKFKYLNIKINGIKKLLPYNGFYPQERATQIVDLFYKSTMDKDTNTLLSEKIFVNQLDVTGSFEMDMMSLLQPLFAPGILFNTIKASIAVDWPINEIYDAPLQFYKNLFPNNPSSSTYVLDNNNFTTRLAFENILNTNIDVINNYVNPTFYGVDVINGTNVSNSSRNSLAYPYKNYLYPLAINNYLAEIPNFFLKDNKLTNFVSLPQAKINQEVVAGKEYYMDVKLYRTSKQKQILDTSVPVDQLVRVGKQTIGSPNSIYLMTSSFTLPECSFYGPPTFNKSNVSTYYKVATGSLSGIYLGNPFTSSYNFYSSNKPYGEIMDVTSFIPYAPPYYYLDSLARIKYKPEYSGLVSLKNILANSTIEYNPDVGFNTAMSLSASVNLKQLTNINKSRFDASGRLLDVDQISDSSLDAWSIQTKFETPLLNFLTDLNTNNTGSMNITSVNLASSSASKIYKENIGYLETLGLWSGYGEIPKNNEGIFLELAETDTAFINTEYKTGSLIQLCGFKVEKKPIGSIAAKKKISEAVVMIPYTLTKNHSNIYNKQYAKTIDEILGENNIFDPADRGAGPYYFEVDIDTISNQLTLPFNDEAKTSVEQIITTIERSDKVNYTSIIDTIYKMTKYNIPPHLDWVTNRSINPFAMYIFEFDHELDQQDLADIWQGVMPKIAKNSQHQTLTIKHKLDQDNFFHSAQLPDDIRWKIFKVKKKANINYYKLTDDTKDDTKFKFNFANQKTLPDYSYNWPYDYFSLVEMVNVEGGFSFSDEEQSTTLKQPKIPYNPLLNLNIKNIKNKKKIPGSKEIASRNSKQVRNNKTKQVNLQQATIQIPGAPREIIKQIAPVNKIADQVAPSKPKFRK